MASSSDAGLSCFSVAPSTTCPHIADGFHVSAKLLPGEASKAPRRDIYADCSVCEACSDRGEGWVCLVCARAGCGRYRNGCMVTHSGEGEHPVVALGLADLSVWCFDCDSYVTGPSLEPVFREMHLGKFGVYPSGSLHSGGGASPSGFVINMAEGAQEPASDGSGSEDSEENEVADTVGREADTTPDKSVPAGASTDIARLAADLEHVSLLPRLMRRISQEHLKTLSVIGTQLREGKFRNIVCLTGAGVSTAAGVPDFRSPGTGLYDNLQKYNLPEPTAIFELEFFRENPKPFFELAKELYPGKLEPTAAHHFIRLLQDKKVLRRLYTQNIDGLDRLAGIQEDLLVECHGSFNTASCISPECMLYRSRKVPTKMVREHIFSNRIPKCPQCAGLTKPDIVFFGETLVDAFHENCAADLRCCDLMIVLGSSLEVYPVAALPRKVRPSVRRLLINRERVGGIGNRKDFDITALGDIEEIVYTLCHAAGWQEDLDTLLHRDRIQPFVYSAAMMAATHIKTNIFYVGYGFFAPVAIIVVCHAVIFSNCHQLGRRPSGPSSTVPRSLQDPRDLEVALHRYQQRFQPADTTASGIDREIKGNFSYQDFASFYEAEKAVRLGT